MHCGEVQCILKRDTFSFRKMCVAWLHSIPLGANVWIGLGNYHFFSRPNTWRVAIAMKMCYFQSNIVGKPQTGIRKSHSNNSQRSGANANQCASLTLICVNLLQKLELGCNIMLISPAVPSQSESKTLSRRHIFRRRQMARLDVWEGTPES